MNIVTFLIIGLLSGFFAAKIVDGRGFGAIGDIILGVMGAFIGGFLFSNFAGSASFWGTVLTSTIGSVILLVAFHAVSGPKRLLKA